VRTLTITPQPQQTRTPTPTHGAWGKMRRAAGEIAPESIERIAQRVAHLLRSEQQAETTHPGAPGLIDATRLAAHLSLNRTWVYEHAHELGAIRVGNGPRARLRFDLATATAALAAHSPDDSRSTPEMSPARHHRRRRRTSESTVPLLPVHEPSRRGIFARHAPTHMQRIVRAKLGGSQNVSDQIGGELCRARRQAR
jgi:hypothetical protein